MSVDFKNTTRTNLALSMILMVCGFFSREALASTAYFHAENFIHNYQVLQSHSGVDIAPVLKADAYGVGLVEVVRKAILPLTPEIVTVTRLEEAEVLREGEYDGRIVMIGSNNLLDLQLASNLGVELVVSDFDLLKEAVEWRIPTHIEFDSGMGRFGFELEEVDEIIGLYKELSVSPIGVSTHLSSADSYSQEDCNFTDNQLNDFGSIVHKMRKVFPSIESHASNSAAVLTHKGCGFDFARVGLALYGQSPLEGLGSPIHQASLPLLKPVISWSTQIAQLKAKKKGDFVGYGRSYKCTHDQRIAILDVGYSDGYHRALSQSGAQVWVKGKRCDVRGNVCMNSVMIDVSNVKDIKVGDEAFLLGPFGENSPAGETYDAPIALRELSEKAKTIPWEILCRIKIY